MLLSLVLAVNSDLTNFKFYGITRSYSSCPFLCALAFIEQVSCKFVWILLGSTSLVARPIAQDFWLGGPDCSSNRRIRSIHKGLVPVRLLPFRLILFHLPCKLWRLTLIDNPNWSKSGQGNWTFFTLGYSSNGFLIQSWYRSCFSFCPFLHCTYYFSNFHFYFIAFMIVSFSGQQLVILTSCSILRIGVNSCLPYTSSNYTQLLSTELLLHY